MESINENVHHIQELIKLNKVVLKQLSLILFKLLDKVKNKQIDKIPLLTFEYIPDEFKQLDNFLNNSDVKIGFELMNERGGEFVVSKNIITLYLTDEFINDLIDVSNDSDFKREDIEALLNKEFKTTLIHELQHAFDSYRSNKKLFTDKEHQDYFNLKNNQKKSFNDWISKNQKWNSYINLSSEVWARVTETIPQLNFYSYKDQEKKLRPIKDILKDFQSKFRYWNDLNNEKKKRVIKFIMNYFYTLS